MAVSPNEPARISTEELGAQQVVPLPPRDLMIAVTVLGIPIVGLTGVSVSIS